MGRQGTERSTRAVRLDAQLTNWECSPVKEQQVSTSEINTRRHRRELPKAAPRSKDRTFRRSRLIDAARGIFQEKGFAATTKNGKTSRRERVGQYVKSSGVAVA